MFRYHGHQTVGHHLNRRLMPWMNLNRKLQETCFHLNIFRGCNPWSPEAERRKVKDVVIHTWFKYVEPPQANEVRSGCGASQTHPLTAAGQAKGIRASAGWRRRRANYATFEPLHVAIRYSHQCHPKAQCVLFSS